MRLIIHRSQADVKGMLGGHKGVSFTLSTRLEFTENLLDHYKMWAASSLAGSCQSLFDI
jgi:hypothetical protein